MTSKALPFSFFSGSTLAVARALLGQVLVRRFGNIRHEAEIVEVEAYTADEPACHAYGGPRPRCQVMFGPAGHAYVYFIYGMYHCLNVVTEEEGIAGAVLIRALADKVLETSTEPTQSSQKSKKLLLNGPGKLCRQLEIDLHFNGIPLFDAKQQLYIKSGRTINNSEVAVSPRIGITKAIDLPWRFYLKDHKSVSRGK
ncbi:DNA-3-methyladenine glycosylase [soil metagenome]